MSSISMNMSDICPVDGDLMVFAIWDQVKSVFYMLFLIQKRFQYILSKVAKIIQDGLSYMIHFSTSYCYIDWKTSIPS